MNLEIDLKSLDIHSIGSWPLPVKAGLVCIICVVVLGAGYYFDTSEQIRVLEQKQAQEQTLRTDFETKQAKAASLDAYREQMKEIEESFGTMLKQLPNRNEVPDLLVDVTQTGLSSGLEFELFEPKPEIRKEFFAEMPINVKLTGLYHDMGEFVSGIAALPRIVTLHEITITPLNKGGRSSTNKGSAGKKETPSDLLLMQAVAKTYRYLDADELAAVEAEARAKAKGKKGKK